MTVVSISRPLESQLRDCFGRAVYTHKAHEKAADLREESLRCLKRCQIALSAITTTGIVATLAGADLAGFATSFSAASSTLLFFLTTYTKELDLAADAQAHKDSAGKLWVIRERYLSLLTDARSNARTEEEARDERDDLMRQQAVIHDSAPRVFDKAYRKACKALQIDEELTFTDAEVDSFLPAPLRVGDGG